MLNDKLTRIEEMIKLASRQMREMREENSNLRLTIGGLQKELEELRMGKAADINHSPGDWQRDKREIRKRIEMIKERVSVLEEKPLGKSN